MSVHVKCRGKYYSTTNVDRTQVPDNLVPFSTSYSAYAPNEFTADFVLRASWADSENTKSIKFNQLDNNVDRSSFCCKYNIENDVPLNPRGRTGVTGRGHLGKWGPNHAADPILTTWKRHNNEKVFDSKSGKPILQFVSIYRKKDHEWAIPGGMVDPGEHISQTLKREFAEEALDSNNHPER